MCPFSFGKEGKYTSQSITELHDRNLFLEYYMFYRVISYTFLNLQNIGVWGILSPGIFKEYYELMRFEKFHAVRLTHVSCESPPQS